MKNAPDLSRGAGNKSVGSQGRLEDSLVSTLPASPLQEKICLFSEWQPHYAEQGIATFPVTVVGKDKKPSVSHYHTIGLQGSAQLASKFHDASAFGFMCGQRNRVTVVDIDSADPGVVEEAVKLFGKSVVWRTGGRGHYAMAFRHSGEERLIRPIPGLPIDILGGGLAVAPPSVGTNGDYEFIQGSIADFANLSPIKTPLDYHSGGSIRKGQRNTTLFKALLRHARHCDEFDSLLDVAMTLNMDCEPPVPDAELVKIAKSAWGYEVTGKNWAGSNARASTDREEILALSHDPYAAHLLNLLRVSHPMRDKRFAIDQVKTAKLLGWARNTLKGCIAALIEAKKLAKVHHGKGLGDPHLYNFDEPLEV